LNKAVIRNVAVNISVQAVTAVAGFILPPLIVAAYGSTQNGMVASIGQFMAYLSIVEAGIFSVSIAALSKPLYDNDKNKINSVVSATQDFYSKAGCVFVCMTFILALIYPNIVEGVDKLTAGLMVLVLSAIGISDFFIVGKYRVLLVADRKYYVLGIIRIIAVILNTLISIVLIKTDRSLLLVKFVSVLGYICVYATILIYVKKRYDFINPKAKFEKNTLEQKWDMMYHKAAGMILDTSPLILLTIFRPLFEVSIYSIYAMIFLAVGQLIDTLLDGMQGFFGRFLAENNPEKLKRFFGKYETIYFSAVGTCYTCALLLTIPFMKIYAKNMTDANYIQPSLAALFVIAGVINKSRMPASVMLMVAGHFKQTKWRAVAEALISVSASIFFIVNFGFIGVLLGTVCSLSYRAPDIIIYSSRHIVHNNPLTTLIKIIVWGTWFCAGYFILSNFVISDIKNYFDFAKNAIISAVFLAVPTGIYLLFSAKSRR